MQEAIEEKHTRQSNTSEPGRQQEISRKIEIQLTHWIKRRTRHEPLQYILGTTPFGELELKCRPGVLIPRVDTETWVAMLGESLRRWYNVAGNNSNSKSDSTKRQGLRIADFCTGSGCISLLLHSILKSPCAGSSSGQRSKIEVYGFDVSPQALALSQENLEHNIGLEALHPSARYDVSFHNLDVLKLSRQSPSAIRCTLNTVTKAGSATSAQPVFDVIVSNPPYISPSTFRSTSSAVTRYEPLLALVPPPLIPQTATTIDTNINADMDALQADQFYPALTHLALSVNAKLLVLEIGDSEQALRVVHACMHLYRAHHKLSSSDASRSRNRDGGSDDLDARFEVWGDCGTTQSFASLRAGFDEEEFRPRAVVMWLDDRWMRDVRAGDRL